MKCTRRTFLAGMTAAATATLVPLRAAAAGPGRIATLVDLTRCDGCLHRQTPACVEACRSENATRFPEPDPAMLKDYWPQKGHEDWSQKRHLTDRLTPYNWTFVQRVEIAGEGAPKVLHIPRRCMHCDNPPCVKLCPFGTLKKATDGPVYIDPDLCFGGAKCRSVCPWNVPQRQAGVGIYTHIDPLPVGGGVMYKCDLCRERLATGRQPACFESCPKQALSVGSREEVIEEARRRASAIGGDLYGLSENGGTSTIYISPVPFERIQGAIDASAGKSRPAPMPMPMHAAVNPLERGRNLAKAALLAPLAGAVGAFAATVKKKEEKRDE